MTVTIIHLSDFHNITGQYENHNVVVDALFEDLSNQLKTLDKNSLYLAFTGDVAQGADDIEQYASFIEMFDVRLNYLGVPKARRIVVPGNHDVSQKTVDGNFVVHEGVVAQNLTEHAFNDFVKRQPNVLGDKFAAYLGFQSTFSDMGITQNQLSGAGWKLSEAIGVYCLNSAICSSGGITKNGVIVRDKRRLQIDTRSLHAWLQESKARWKILLMHHPLHWLTDECEKELKAVISKHVSLRLFGHEHEQDMLHSVTPNGSSIGCCAPALFSKKRDQLGYSIISIDNSIGITQINYRQWTKYQSFVAGTSFSNTDNGKIVFKSVPSDIGDLPNDPCITSVSRYFSLRLEKSLVSFYGQPRVWVTPVLKYKPRNDNGDQPNETVDIDVLLLKPVFSLIKAPPQFGLTCLAHYLVKEAWIKHSRLWLYLDVNELKPHAASIGDAIEQELRAIGLSLSAVQCVVLDSIAPQNKDSWKILTKIIEKLPAVPVIGMQTAEPDPIPMESHTTVKFQSLFLWPLSRGHLRTIVSGYNEARIVGDEDSVLTRIASDLDVLNLHRTPLNCLTLLKACEVDFDESPVNRSEMIKRVLFLLFNVETIPTYKARPDLKDCEYVLAYFCETMLRENMFTFSRTHFLNTLQRCCQERLIDLEVQVVFDVLSANNILVSRDGQFTFRFVFWIYYFAALRMRDSDQFASYILSEMRYANHPELIEFYTGIDRQRADALSILTRDLRSTRHKVHEKCGFPEHMDPYKFAQWTPSDEIREKMKAEIQNGVEASNLPAAIKDLFADKSYDANRPYDQSVRILGDSAVVYMKQTMRAASKALRNSDYVNPDVKRALLEEILMCWEQLTILLLVLTPVLAEKGVAAFDGQTFMLNGDFSTIMEKRLTEILVSIPHNVVMWSQDDLFSQKMGPLLIDVLKNQKSDLRRHELLRLILTQRPRGWAAQVKGYIASIHKNSFYLWDVFSALRIQYQYSYATDQTLKEIAHLIEMAMTKHVTGHKDPGIKLIQKTVPKVTMDENGTVVPVRSKLTESE